MDKFTMESMSLINEEDIKVFKGLGIRVEVSTEHDGVFETVHVGSAHDFLVANQYEENIVKSIFELIDSDLVEINEVSGHWKIFKK